MASLNFKKVGGLVKIEFNSEPDYYVPALQTKIRFYEPSDGTSFLIVSVDADKYQLSAITEIKVDGVAVTNQADFETKIATVFPNTNSGSGGTGGTYTTDIEITDYTQGFILRTSDGARGRITLIKDADDSLQLTLTLL